MEENISSVSKDFGLVPTESIRAVVHIALKICNFREEDNDGREQIKTRKNSCEDLSWETKQFYVNRFIRP